jgi:3-deoxy-D-manno-octulosonate 8-phosphate phosphatase (KDO 8-P phosphatase)
MWAAVFDVDGVLTDGTFTYSENGKFTKTFGAHDSDALNRIKSKIEIIFISADRRGFGISQKRIEDMGFDLKLVPSIERKSFISNLKQEYRVIFVGDSFTDVLALREANISVVPADAHNEAKKASQLILQNKGGQGAVSEICLFIGKVLKIGYEI